MPRLQRTEVVEIVVHDVAIICGGIIGTSAAAYLSEAGLSVVLFEREAIAAGASGRNSGVVQQPLDPVLAALHRQSLGLYRSLAEEDDLFTLGVSPAGLLMLTDDDSAAAQAVEGIGLVAPELRPSLVDAAVLSRLEPGLAADLVACRVDTAYPVDPASATTAFARLAERRGVDVRVGEEAVPQIEGGRVEGGRAQGVRLRSGKVVPSGQVLVAAGPWSTPLIPGWWTSNPIRPLWGVVVSTSLPSPPVHVLEELGIDRPGPQPQALFSLVPLDGGLSVGSTFVGRQPAPQPDVEPILKRARRFVPALADAAVEGARVCARPLSRDSRPFIGPIAQANGLFVCAGHGPWGISTGPASARLVSELMIGTSPELPEYSPARLVDAPRDQYGDMTSQAE